MVLDCNLDQTECVADIPVTAQKPITLTRELSTGGSKISVTSTFVQPFNLKKDQLELEFKLSVLPPTMSDVKISRLELTGRTQDKRTVALSDKYVNKYLYEGGKVNEYLVLDFQTAEKDGEFTNLDLKIHLDYVLTSGTTSTQKSVILTHKYPNLKFEWARPEKSPGCPECDDGNPGTADTCGPETNYFCDYTPIPGKCGNSICETAENECTCAQDCGPCAGGGRFLTKSCVGTNCFTQVKPDISVQPKSLFDDRDLSVFHLQNNYRYNNPFNTKTDAITLEFSLYEKQDAVSSIKIKTVRVLSGTEELAHASIDKEFTEVGQQETAEIKIPAVGKPEQDRTLNLRVWYEYVKDGQTTQNDYSKPLGKITLLNPDV